MKKNKVLAMIILFVVVALGLTSCESVKKDDVSTIVQCEIVDADGVSTVNYKAQITNNTIYDFSDISFDIEGLNEEESLGITTGYDAKDVVLTHGKSIVFEGSFEKPLNFDSARVTNLVFTSRSFMDTYRAFVILMPIVTIAIAGIVMYTLLKNDTNSKIDGKRTSIVGICGLFAMSLMINTVGWVPILFIFVASGLIFLSGYVAVIIKKHQYIPQEVIDAMKAKEEAEKLEDASDNEAIDAEVIEGTEKNDSNDDIENK